MPARAPLVCPWAVVLATFAGCGTDSLRATGAGPDSSDQADASPSDNAGIEVCAALQPGEPSRARVPAPYAGTTNPLGSAAASVGRSLFRTWCARCHGLDARGGGGSDPPPADLTAAARPDDYLFWRISEGGHGDPDCSQMPSFKHSLSEERRWELVAYLRSIEADADASDSGVD